MRTSALATLTLLTIGLVNGQYTAPDPSGFQGLIVEPYYVADEADAANTDGGPGLTAGTKVYRVYADMLPGYKLITVGGFPGYPMSIGTTTAFFNNEDRGEAWGRSIPANNLDDNTVAIDSWLTFGAASNQHWGVLKSDDTDGSIVGGSNNNDGLLVNEAAWAGAPLTEVDGLYATGTAPQQLVFLGDAPTSFDPGGSNTYTNDNFAWSILGGVEGPTAENRVLIGQFATDGEFSFCLNLTVKIPEDSICDDPNCHNFLEFLATMEPADTVGGGFGVQNKFNHPTLCFTSSTAIVDCAGTPGGTALPGTACDDGNADTSNDTYTETCACQGDDCEGVQGGDALPGTPCDDGDEETIDDAWTSSCQCAGTITHIVENDALAGISLAPNPTADLTLLTFRENMNGTATLTLMNLLGEVVMTQNIASITPGSTQAVDLSSCAPGAYLLRVSTEAGQRTFRIHRR
ncbi:MAG: T9SS type A sorting domain-containing protein [Flavobacteriales bacterium]|nr:T9SS type A sorting domain-containing protein [Flavobacteriales bacterium]